MNKIQLLEITLMCVNDKYVRSSISYIKLIKKLKNEKNNEKWNDLIFLIENRKWEEGTKWIQSELQLAKNAKK